MLDRLGPRTPASRRLMIAAAFWGVSAVIHLGVIAGTSGDWSGPVSFRKPIVFSASMAALMWAVGWIIDRLRPRPRLASAIAWSIVISGSCEVLLIVFQTWRGRASHFNVFDPEDAVIFAAMGVAIGILSAALLVLAIWSVWDRPSDLATRWAVLGGQGMILAGLGIGQWIIDLGVRYVETVGSVPGTVIAGEAGVAKFPHAVAFHGIQVFAILWSTMFAAGWDEARRTSSMRRVVAAYAVLLVVAAVRTYEGHTPLDLGMIGGIGAVVSVAVIVHALGTSVRAVLGRSSPERAVEPAPAALP